MKNINLFYQVPISESAIVEGDFIIQGTAINETITSNNHKFIAEELMKSASTLTGCPLLVDHENKVENIKGRVLKGLWNESERKIDFKAKVMDEKCKEMIKDGRLNSVSVGAMVGEIDEEAGGVLVPKNITFKELSLVAVPADGGATFSIAMKEAYNANKKIKESPEEELADTDEIVDQEDEKEDEPILDESQQVNPENVEQSIKDVQGSDNLIVMKGGMKQMSEEQVTETAKVEVVETVVEAKAETKVDETAELKSKLELAEKANKELSEKISVLTAPKVEEKLRNEFEETDAEVKTGYKIVQGLGYFSFVADKY